MWRASSSSARNPSRSASTIVADNAARYHDFKIDGYSRVQNLPNGESLKSSPFIVGGHRWRIAFLPNGDIEDEMANVIRLGDAQFRLATPEKVSVYLVLDDVVTEPVMAQYEFAFMVEKQAPFFRKRMQKVSNYFERAEVKRFVSGSIYGFPNLMNKSTLECQSGVRKNDTLTIRCDLVVFKELRPTAETAIPSTFVPPSDLHQQFGDLLLTGKGADVLFKVGGETFPAHRSVLAARSPVFNAEFFGTMQESTNTASSVIQVEDMVAPVFRALLCFLYTDSLPETTKEDEVAMYQHLLVAADRYSVERLKLICEDKLCKNIDVPKVATILALAEQHNCIVLKKLCLDFLSAPANLKAAMATDGFKHLSTSCPSIKKDLDAMLAS